MAIEYCGADAGPEARYLQAWLRAEVAAASVELRRVDTKEKGDIKGIRIGPDLSVRVKANCAEYETGSLRQRANLPASTEQDLLSEELSIMTHDPVFERALQRMSPWTPRS